MFNKGKKLYDMGKANSGRGEIDKEMIDRALNKKGSNGQLEMNYDQRQTLNSLIAKPFPQGLCFPLVAMWASNFLINEISLTASVGAPYELVSPSGGEMAKWMQGEHMTRVRKRVAQNKFSKTSWQMENKVLGSFNDLEQEIVYNKLKEDAGQAIQLAMNKHSGYPLKLSLTFVKDGSHSLGLVRQIGFFYLFDPNKGLFEYQNVGEFKDDIGAMLANYGDKKPPKVTKEIELTVLKKLN